MSELNKALAPYDSVNDLSPKIRKHLSADLQKVFIDVFNNAYEKYNDEIIAIKTSWKVIKKIGQKNLKNIWVRKNKKAKAEEIIALSNEMLEKTILEEEGNNE